MVAVVAHDEQRPRWNGGRAEVVPVAVHLPSCQRYWINIDPEGVMVGAAVQENLFVDNLDRVAGQSYDPFDVVLAFVFRIYKDDHIAPAGFFYVKQLYAGKGYADSVEKLVYQYMIADQQGRLHGAGRNLEGLYDKRP